MAPVPGRPLRMPSSFDCTAIPPSPLTNRPSSTLSSASSPPLSRFVFYPSSPATFSSPPPFFFELSDPPEGRFLSHIAATSEPTASYSTAWATTASNTTQPGDAHTSLPRVPLPSVFCSLSSLTASPHLLKPCETRQSQQVNLSSTAVAPFVDGFTVAAMTTWPHAPAAVVASAKPEAEPSSVQGATSPTSENAAEETHSCFLARFRNNAGWGEDLSSTQPLKTSPRSSRSLVPVFLCGKRSYSTPAGAAAAQPGATDWAAATHSCYLDIEACHSFAHRIPSGLRTCYSLQGRTLLSPPAVEISPPLEESETLHAGLRLDSPMPSRLSSPTSPRSYTCHDHREKCNATLSSTLPEKFIPTSQTLHHRSLFLSVLPKSFETLSSRHCSPRVSEIWETDTNEGHPEAAEPIQSAAAAFESRKFEATQAVAVVPESQNLSPEEPGTFTEQPKSSKYKTRRILQLIDKGNEMTDREHLTVGILEKEHILFPTSSAPNKNKNRRTGTAALTSWPFLQNRKSTGYTSSPHVCCHQTRSVATAAYRGTTRRKRKRGTSSPSRQRNTVTTLKISFRDEVQAPADVMKAAPVTASPERHIATGVKPSPAIPLTAASPTAFALAPSPTTADSMSSAGDLAVSSLSVAPAPLDGVPVMFAALDHTGGSAVVDNAEVLSATFSHNETPTVIDGKAADSAAFNHSLACAAVDSTPVTSAGTAVSSSDFHPVPRVAAEHFAPSSYLTNSTTPGSTAAAGCLSPAAVVSALSAAAGSSLSPGAVGYALAVKLFGFTPTPGFLPDPNPFDNLDQYLIKEPEGATVTTCSNNVKPQCTNTSAVPNPQIPPLVTTEYASGDRTWATEPPAACRRSGSGYTDASVERPVKPPTHRVAMQRKSLISKSDNTHFEHVAPMCTRGGENAMTMATVYPLTSLPATAIAAPVYCAGATSAVHHAQGRTSVISLPPVNSCIRNSTSFSQRAAMVKNASEPFSTMSDKLPDDPVRTDGQHTQSGAYSPRRILMNDTGYMPGRTPQEEVIATEGQMQVTCQARQGFPLHGMERDPRCSTQMKSHVLIVDKNQKGERHSVHSVRGSTVYEGCLYEGSGCNGHATQFSENGAGSLSHTNLTERQFECVAGSYRLGEDVLGCEPSSKSVSSSYDRGIVLTGASTQNSNYIQAAEGSQIAESRVYAQDYLQGEKCLAPALPPHGQDSFAQSSTEYKDRIVVTTVTNSESLAEVADATKDYSSIPNTSASRGLCSTNGGTSDRPFAGFLVEADAAGVPADPYSRTYE